MNDYNYPPANLMPKPFLPLLELSTPCVWGQMTSGIVWDTFRTNKLPDNKGQKETIAQPLALAYPSPAKDGLGRINFLELLV